MYVRTYVLMYVRMCVYVCMYSQFVTVANQTRIIKACLESLDILYTVSFQLELVPRSETHFF